MNDVAKAAGVSLKTVSRVVNDEGGVRPELTARVEQAITRLRYRRNDIASMLRAGAPKVSVGLIIEDLGNPFYSAIARGVEDVLAEHGHILLTASSDKDPVRERELLLDLCSRRVDGVIIVPAAADHEFLQREVDFGLQVVFLDRPGKGVDGDTVVIDNRGGAAAAVKHLLGLGHTRISFIATDDHWTVRQRMSGYESELRHADLAIDKSLIKLGLRGISDAAAATSDLLDLASPPTAFFADNNLMTMGVLTELQRRDISMDVAGFDDIDAAPLFRAPLTVVAYDPMDLGRRAARSLIERFEGRRTPRRVVVSTTLKSYGVRP